MIDSRRGHAPAPIARAPRTPQEAALHYDTLVRGLASVRVTRRVDEAACASEACRYGGTVHAHHIAIRVTYMPDDDGDRRDPECYHPECYRWEFCE